MILNAYAVLDVFLCLLRLAFSLVVIGVGAYAWKRARRALSPEARKALEDRTYLLFLVAVLLLGLNVVSWPLLYLLLQSYVPEWPDVMCIYGVTQIGRGSVGVSRFLPGLLKALQLTKPALVFGSGAWLVLYLINRRTQSAPLLGRILAMLVFVGLLAAGDSAAELAYMWIPKKEEFQSLGCCTAVFDDRSGSAWLAPDPVLGVGDRPRLSVAYYAVNAGMVVGLFAYAVQARHRARVARLTPLLLGAALALPVSAAFLVEVVAPVLLGLPFHHCPYDLIPQAPEAVVSAALFLWGTFSVGWAWVAARWGDCPESRAFLPWSVGTILLTGLFCYLGSAVMMTVALALA